MSNPVNSAPNAAPTQTADTSQQPTQSTAGTAAPQGQAKPTQAEIRKVKLQLEGKDVEMSEQEIAQLIQKGRGADKKFQEAAQARKEAEAFAHMLKANPKEAMERLGIDVRDFSEKTLIKMLEEDRMSPEQKKARDNERKLREYEDSEKKSKEEAQAKQLKDLEDQHLADYNKLFTDALASSGLPKTPFTVKRMAQLQLLNVKKGLDLDAGQLAKIVREDYESEIKALYSNADGDSLMAILGDDNVKKLSRAQIKKLKAAAPKFSTPTKEEPRASNEPKSSWREFQKRNRST